jgi:hypothetical protein
MFKKIALGLPICLLFCVSAFAGASIGLDGAKEDGRARAATEIALF